MTVKKGKKPFLSTASAEVPPRASGPSEDASAADEEFVGRVVRLLPELILSAEAPDISLLRPGGGGERALAIYMLRWAALEACGRGVEAGSVGATAVGAGRRSRDFSKTSGPNRPPQDFSKELIDTARDALRRDIPSQLAVAIISRYFASQAADNYLVLGSFFERFRHVHLGRLSFAHLPRRAAAYVELPSVVEDCYGHKFSGFFFYCGPTSALLSSIRAEVSFSLYPSCGDCVAMAYLDQNDHTVSYVLRPFPLEEKMDMLIADSLPGSHYHQSPPYEAGSLAGSGKMQMLEEELEGYPEHVRLLFNLLAYIQSGDPDLRQYRNQPRLRGGPGSKPVNADRFLSSLPLTLVSFAHKKIPLYAVGEWEVLPHLRAVSASASTPARLVWVRQHTRRRRDGVGKDRLEKDRVWEGQPSGLAASDFATEE